MINSTPFTDDDPVTLTLIRETKDHKYMLVAVTQSGRKINLPERYDT